MSAEEMVTWKLNRMAQIALVFVNAGCATISPPEKPVANRPAPLIASQFGEVVSVNAGSGYVVLECAVLPKEGEELTLYRGNGQSGRVKINRHISGDFAAADVLEGSPETGDRFLVPPVKTNP